MTELNLNDPEQMRQQGYVTEVDIMTGKKILRKIGGAGENIYSSALGEISEEF